LWDQLSALLSVHRRVAPPCLLEHIAVRLDTGYDSSVARDTLIERSLTGQIAHEWLVYEF
jgi:hypothetical protein